MLSVFEGPILTLIQKEVTDAWGPFDSRLTLSLSRTRGRNLPRRKYPRNLLDGDLLGEMRVRRVKTPDNRSIGSGITQSLPDGTTMSESRFICS